MQVSFEKDSFILFTSFIKYLNLITLDLANKNELNRVGEILHQAAFACSKLTIESIEQGVKYVQS